MPCAIGAIISYQKRVRDFLPIKNRRRRIAQDRHRHRNGVYHRDEREIDDPGFVVPHINPRSMLSRIDDRILFYVQRPPAFAVNSNIIRIIPRWNGIHRIPDADTERRGFLMLGKAKTITDRYKSYGRIRRRRPISHRINSPFLRPRIIGKEELSV